GERILAEAANNRQATADPTGHAELLALREAGRALGHWHLDDCSLAVTLEPCPMCAGALVNARLGRLVYGADDPKAGACRTLYRIPTDQRLNHQVTVLSGVLGDPCAKLASRRATRPCGRRRRRAARPSSSSTRPAASTGRPSPSRSVSW
ncbi:MAG: nucleoside deaminase, partial [Planctomycetota bacterium]